MTDSVTRDGVVAHDRIGQRQTCPLGIRDAAAQIRRRVVRHDGVGERQDAGVEDATAVVAARDHSAAHGEIAQRDCHAGPHLKHAIEFRGVDDRHVRARSDDVQRAGDVQIPGRRGLFVRSRASQRVVAGQQNDHVVAGRGIRFHDRRTE